MADRVAVNLVARQWSPFKELYHTVDAAISQKTPDSYHDLEVALRKYKPDFISLLKNPSKNPQHREQVKKANTVGIVIEGQPGTRTLPQHFIEEALIISDLFDLNEYSAVELLLAGEQQQPHFPGLQRGLVAVLLYFDGRRSIVNALHLLIQSRKGRTWTLELDDELTLLNTNFTNQLLQDGLIDKILKLLIEVQPEKELEKLAKQRAIGGVKHRQQVTNLLKEIRISLAECLFSWACQTPFDKNNTLTLINYLKKNVGLTAEGALDDVAITLLTTFMYCTDVSVLEPNVENRDEIVKMLPCLADASYIPALQQILISEEVWIVPDLKSVVQFVWAVMLRNIAQQPETQGLQDHIETDEMIVDMALDGGALKFLLNNIIKRENFHDAEFQVRRIHTLITDFIIQMPLKIKELRNRGDEAARILLAHAQEGVEPPATLPRHFEHLMRLISVVYGKDPLNLELSLEFWCPSEPSLSPSRGSYITQYRQRPTNRQVSLFKFIRMAGDLLPPSLYVPYIAMLTGLANGVLCAHHCFNLLKVNSMAGGGSVTSVSWDHFFQSLNCYYANLRRERGGNQSAGQTYRHMSGITPQELEGLVTVLLLVQMVAQWDEEARIGLCENQSWLPTVLLFGIVTCSVPPELKAECLKTLATFANTPEIAANLWQALESSQILPTLDNQSTCGIPVDLEMIESRNEHFPLTLGFMDFISNLVNIPIPSTLGAGLRAPGFDPYLEFLRDQVFLKFHTRAYRDAKEKWEIASKALMIFHKLLQSHESCHEDFMEHILEIQGGGKTIANKPPGHHILLHLFNDTSMLKLMLYIIHEARRLLDQYKAFPGQEHLDNAALYCLKMIEITMEKQEVFFDLVRGQGSGIMVTPMDQLLMAINPKTGKADHIVNIIKFVTHATTHPEQALVSVKVLLNMVKTSNIQPQIVGLFTVDEDVSRELINGFVECLETEDHEDDDGDISETLQDNESSDVENIRNSTRLYIMRLLLFSLAQPAPNLTHFFLGFDIRKPVNKTSLQDPGVLGSPRTCLHSILSILERGITKGTGLTSIHTMPKLADLSYEMIYSLCANRDTSIPIMRYLGMTHNFFFRHLKHVPFTNGIGQHTSEKLLLNQQAWLLKSVAVEIRLTAVNRQRSYTQRLLNVLLEDVPSAIVDHDDGDDEGQTNQSLFDTTVGQQVGPSITGMQVRRKILQILDTIDLAQDYPRNIELDLLDPAITDQLIRTCEQQTDRGITVCNVHALHRVLMGMLNAQQGPEIASKRPMILEEIKDVLKNMVACNLSKEMASAKRHTLDAWRQVVEIVFASCSQDLLPLKLRETILLELVQELLIKVSKEDTVPELTAPVSGILVSLMTNLRQCAVIEQSKAIPDQLSNQYIQMLDGSVVHGSSGSVFGSASRLSSTALMRILRLLVVFTINSSPGQFRVRSNLYSALLNFLQMPQKVQEIPTLKGRNVLDSAMLTEHEKMTSASLAVISEFGESFMELVCRDACDGHDVGRMLALSVIDSILATDKQKSWLQFLNSKGYLQHLIESLVQEDQALQDMLKPTPEPLRALYIYESKMSLLTRLGETPMGAEALLQQSIMGRLSECQFLELRPERDIARRGQAGDSIQADSFIPTVLHRYRQLLFPVLKLCIAIMTSLGGQHKEATNQILHFVLSHSDLFTTILRDHPSQLKLEAFQELSLATAVICRTAADVDYYGGSPYDEISQSQLVVQGHLSRIQRQILALVPRYCIHDHWNKRLKMAADNECSDDDKEKIRLVLLEIGSNILSYCRSEVTSTGVTSAECNVLFTPSLSEALAREYQRVDDIPMASLRATKPPSLGVIVRHLRQVANTFLPSFDSHQQMVHKLSNITELSLEELKEIIKPAITDTIEKLSSSHRQQMACRQLAQLIRHKAKELALKYYTLENCLFLVWRHLQFYMVHCQPADSNSSLLPPLMSKSNQARNLADPFAFNGSRTELEMSISNSITNPAHTITKGDILQLKEEAVACLTEPLLQKLRDMEGQYGKTLSRYSFVSVLARRIQWLLTFGIQTDVPIR